MIKKTWLVALVVSIAALAPTAGAVPPTTVDRTVTGNPDSDFSPLRAAPGWPRQVRQELGPGHSGRQARRTSLIYFSALDELHYTDEESPARVEFLDINDSPFTSAWFPEESLLGILTDRTFRAVNQFVPASPVSQGNGSRARMTLALTTADSADNQQVNEINDYVRLLEGGRLDPNSGVATAAPCPAGQIPAGEAARYTGVQDYDDYAPTDGFYDPDQPAFRYSAFPRYPGLMDRAQLAFDAQGLRVPSYVTVGNHDRLSQGNQWTNAAFEAVATGCVKPFAEFGLESLTPEALLASPDRVKPVPPDPERRSVQYPGFRALHDTGRQADAHGFRYVDPQEAQLSNGAASYYAWSPKPHLRFISINTASEGGVAGPSAEGNLDDPQYRWLAGQLQQAQLQRQLVVVFGHHPIASLRSPVADEAAPPCGPGPGRDPNPGCDLDPRPSVPIHLGDQGPANVRDLLLANKNVVLYVAGHSTDLRVIPFSRPTGGGFWQVESGSVSHWPTQARLLELMDNRDGTLSIFGTMINPEIPLGIPASGTAAAGFSPNVLAAVGRTLSFNDLQRNPNAQLGSLSDRNVELLLPNPLRG